jgi:uridine kinase
MTASPDPGGGPRVVERFADLAAEIRSRPARFGGRRLVAIDGPSGSGKTVFARRLSGALGGAPVVHTDHLLNGWDDQLTFWDRLEELALGPLRRGEPARYRRYRWHRGDFGGAPVVVEPAEVVLLEGVTAARAVIRPELSLAVVVTAPGGLRLQRALDRDGAHLLPYLHRWRAGEDAHFAADRTVAHADLIVDGAAPAGDDAGSGYVRWAGAAQGSGRRGDRT